MAGVGIGRLRRGGGTIKPASWGRRFPGRGGDTGKRAFSFQITNLNGWLRSMEREFYEALDEAEPALEKSLKQHVVKPSLHICPIDTGALRTSVWVSVMRVAGGRLQAHVGYDTDYALYVHEDPDAAHAPPTRWKFLEEPFVVNAPKVALDVLKAVRQELEG